MSIYFTPTECRMLRVLADGNRHTKVELHACLEDELSSIKAIQKYLSNVRAKLKPIGQDIVCEYFKGKFMYRQVRLLNHRE